MSAAHCTGPCSIQKGDTVDGTVCCLLAGYEEYICSPKARVHCVYAGSDADADKCNACVCAVNDAFIPAFRAANIIQESTEPAVFPKAKADEVLRACVPAYLGQVTAAGVELSTLAGLQDCPVDASPACLSVVNQKLRANADNATATGAPTAAPTAPSTTGTDQAINAVQNVVGRVSNAGQQVVEAGQSAVNAGQSAAQTIRSVFNG